MRARIIFKLIWKNRLHLFPTREIMTIWRSQSFYPSVCSGYKKLKIMVVNDGALQIDQNNYIKILNTVFEMTFLIKMWRLDRKLMIKCLKYLLYGNHLPIGQITHSLLINRWKTKEQNYQNISWDKRSKGIQDNPGTKIKSKGKKSAFPINDVSYIRK